MSNKDINNFDKNLADTVKILNKIGRAMDRMQAEREADIKKQAEERKKQAEERKKEAEERKRQEKKQAEERKKEAEERKRQEKKQAEERKKEAEERKRQEREKTEEQKKWEEELKAYRKEFNQFMGRTGNQWGDLGENLIKGSLVKRLNERGIKIDRVIQDYPASHIAEFDFIALNGTEAVVIEVKCSLNRGDVYKFLKRLKKVQKICPDLKLKEKKIYGAVAFLTKATKKSREAAKKEGLFLISGTGDTIIESPKNFKPKLIELEADS